MLYGPLDGRQACLSLRPLSRKLQRQPQLRSLSRTLPCQTSQVVNLASTARPTPPAITCGTAGPAETVTMVENAHAAVYVVSWSPQKHQYPPPSCYHGSRKCSLPLLISSSWGSGEGLSFKGEVLGPTGGFVGALNGTGGGGGGGCGGCGGRAGCCSIRAWILLLPSALKWDMDFKLEGQEQWFSGLPRLPSTWKSLQKPRLFTASKYWYWLILSHKLLILLHFSSAPCTRDTETNKTDSLPSRSSHFISSSR